MLTYVAHPGVQVSLDTVGIEKGQTWDNIYVQN